MKTKSWIYPRIIAHRGAGALAPENTLVSMAVGARYGHKMVEFDVQLSKDKQPFLLHDDTLDRTTDNWGIATEKTWQELRQVDAGSWLGENFYNEKIPSLAEIAQFTLKNDLAVNIEIKPRNETDIETANIVVHQAIDLFKHHPLPPLFSSFSIESLRIAKNIAPDLPRGLLIHEWREDWKELTDDLGCYAFHLNHELLNEQRIKLIKEAGLFIFTYTVNNIERAKQLISWGIDAICTDRIVKIPADFYELHKK